MRIEMRAVAHCELAKSGRPQPQKQEHSVQDACRSITNAKSQYTFISRVRLVLTHMSVTGVGLVLFGLTDKIRAQAAHITLSRRQTAPPQ